jgi:hypothetical protein
MKKKLIITASQKGGAGKTFLACVLLDYMRCLGMSVDAYDGDGANGGLFKVMGIRDAEGKLMADQDASIGVTVYDFRLDQSRDLLINSLDSANNIILHDLAGGALLSLLQIFDDDPADGGLKNLDEVLGDEQAELIILHLITDEDETVASLGQYLKLCELCENIHHIAVINQLTAKQKGLTAWYGAPDGKSGGNTRERFLTQGGLEMSLPKLEPVVMAQINQRAMPFSTAIVGNGIKRAHRGRIALFQKQFAAGLTPDVRDLLGVSK